jgi:hypothetical protein
MLPRKIIPYAVPVLAYDLAYLYPCPEYPIDVNDFLRGPYDSGIQSFLCNFARISKSTSLFSILDSAIGLIFG